MERLIVRYPSDTVKLDVLGGQALRRGRQTRARLSFAQPDLATLTLADPDRARLEKLGAQVFEDVQFRVLAEDDDDDGDSRYATWSRGPVSGGPAPLSLKDVTTQIRAPQAWQHTRGEGATIAILDTGIDGSIREIGWGRRSRVDLRTAHQGDHWNDAVGHGSMCAAIAAGSARSGRYDGVAPDATLIAARTNLLSTDLFEAYDELIRLKADGTIAGPLVVSNSFGLYVCEPPKVLPVDHPFMANVLAAIDAGIFVCFAAGNNHTDPCGHDPRACGPNSIWGPNSHDRVVSVGTVNRDLTNRDPATSHVRSSRGPGEWAVEHPKPDCVAPTYGEVPWGAGYMNDQWWGTSGACPQVAGLAGLILSVAPGLQPDMVADMIRTTCRSLTGDRTCIGAGVIDCEAGVHAALDHRSRATT